MEANLTPETISTPMTRRFGNPERPVRFEEIEETLVQELLRDIKPGEKRLVSRISEKIKNANNFKTLKKISLAIRILRIPALGIPGFILLHKLLKNKKDKLSK